MNAESPSMSNFETTSTRRPGYAQHYVEESEMHVTTCRLVFAFTLVMGNSSFAQSLVMQLPADGEWATYKMESERKAPDGRPSRSVELRLTVRVVGTEGDGDSKLRWIEIEITKPDGENVEVHKVLIPEASIGKNRTILNAISKYIIARGSDLTPRIMMPPNPVHLERYFNGKINQVESVVGQTISTPRGDFQCEGIQGISTQKAEQERTTRYKCFLNPGVPFGSVKFSSNMEIKDNGQAGVIGNIETTLILENWGDGAKSVFQNSQINVTRE